MTGGLEGGVYKTDVTNASRTMFMNIETLEWDNELLEFFGVDRSALCDIVSNGERYGDIKYDNCVLNGTPIAGECLCNAPQNNLLLKMTAHMLTSLVYVLPFQVSSVTSKPLSSVTSA